MTAADLDAPVEPAAPPRWGAIDLIVAFVVAQVASVLAVGALASAKGVPVEDMTEASLSLSEIAVLQVPLWLGLLGLPLLSTWFRGNGAVRDLGLRMVGRDIPVGLAIGVACQFVLVPLITWPMLELTGSSVEDVEERARTMTDKATGLGVVLLVIIVVVGAPVAEEVFYRGMLQRTMNRRLPIWPTMVITALVFAASHGQFLQFPALAAFGLVLSYLAYRTGRLGPSIWAHVGFNATTVVILLGWG